MRAVKKISRTAKPANDKVFHNFRKDKYYETVQTMKELQAQKDLAKEVRFEN
jgi:hypothetical protein